MPAIWSGPFFNYLEKNSHLKHPYSQQLFHERLFKLTALIILEFTPGCHSFEQDEFNSFQGREKCILKHKSRTVETQLIAVITNICLICLSAYFLSCFAVMMSDCPVTKNLPAL